MMGGASESPSSLRWIITPFGNVINCEGDDPYFLLKSSISPSSGPKIRDFIRLIINQVRAYYFTYALYYLAIKS